ncbi:G domain-containing protein [Nostoc sp. DSM 114161]|jgi:small GTP-binding protein|uniref:GTPase n=1 Tax=Nostoc sp. DSM 114161 TaxID=3440143 RepID=UPI00404581EB
MVSNQEIREEISHVQAELEEALKNLKQQFGKKLKEKERQDIENEFLEINELLERLKTGLIWVALFGKTSVGKSAILNSLINDDVAEVGVEHDKTIIPTSYKKEPWNIVDVPGIMGEQRNEKLAIEEAKKAHGHIFAIDGEPYQDELELFDLVHENSPDIPKIVFVNKWDIVKNNKPKKDQETIRSRISEKMGKFVKSPEDIVYGSAMLFDQKSDEMIRQELPQLLDRLHESAGTLGALMNILDPAQRAVNLTDSMNKRIFDTRLKLVRKFIGVFSSISALAGAVPFATLLVHPPLLVSMVFTICVIMGKKQTKSEAIKITQNIFGTCGKVIGASFMGTVGIVFITDMASTVLAPIGGIGILVGLLASIGGVGYFSYKYTATLGEVTVEYLRNGFSWGEEGEAKIIKRCQEQVKEIYMKLKPI